MMVARLKQIREENWKVGELFRGWRSDSDSDSWKISWGLAEAQDLCCDCDCEIWKG
jgi:hypothetical protein